MHSIERASLTHARCSDVVRTSSETRGRKKISWKVESMRESMCVRVCARAYSKFGASLMIGEGKRETSSSGVIISRNLLRNKFSETMQRQSH